MQFLLVIADVGIGHSGNEVVGIVQRQIYQLKCFQGLLLLHVERPDDPLIRQCLHMAIAAPRCKGEQENRKQKRRGDGKPQQPDRQSPCLHVGSNPGCGRRLNYGFDKRQGERRLQTEKS